MITIHFNDFTVGEYKTEQDAKDAILEALAEGVLVDYVHETGDEDKIYSLVWAVELQEET